MTFYHDRISAKEGIDTKTDDHLDRFIDESISKNVMAVLYFFIIKTILTIENGSVKDAIKSY